MSIFLNVARLPTVRAEQGSVHESCYRAAHILNVVKAMLQDGVPPKWILEAIAVMESPGQQEKGT